MGVLVSILIFLLVIFVLVLVHEFGHFIVAKKAGMRVDEFGIGFPPKLFGIKKGETEYTFNLFPVGGFVKIFGEDAVDTESASDRERSFVAKSKLAQALVLVAGVTMNVLLAWLLFVVAFSIGVPTGVDEATASADAQLIVHEVIEESPAQRAGLQPGVIITEVNSGEDNLDTLTPSALTSFIQDHEEREISIEYMVGGETFAVSVTPEADVLDGSDRQLIGLSSGLIETVRRPIHVALIEATSQTVNMLGNVVVALSTLIWDALQFEADLSQVAGPVGIVGVVGEFSALGLTSLLLFAAFISLNLAVINMLPFPALDGGRLLFVAIEAVKGSPIKPQVASTLNTIGFALLILLMIAVTYNDILRLV